MLRFETINHIFKEMVSEMSLFQVVTDNFHQVQLLVFIITSVKRLRLANRTFVS